MINVKVVVNEEEKNDAFIVRKTVFVEEQKVSCTIERDEFDLDKDTIHFVAYDMDKPIGASRARLMEDYVKLERICILNSYRGKNIGTILLSKMEEYLLLQGKTIYRLSAQNDAANFYIKCGYVSISEPYIEKETGIMHILMQKTLIS